MTKVPFGERGVGRVISDGLASYERESKDHFFMSNYVCLRSVSYSAAFGKTMTFHFY